MPPENALIPPAIVPPLDEAYAKLKSLAQAARLLREQKA